MREFAGAVLEVMLFVVRAAEPADFERLAIVVMVGHDLSLSTADFAGLADEIAVPNSVCD